MFHGTNDQWRSHRIKKTDEAVSVATEHEKLLIGALAYELADGLAYRLAYGLADKRKRCVTVWAVFLRGHEKR